MPEFKPGARLSKKLAVDRVHGPAVFFPVCKMVKVKECFARVYIIKIILLGVIR